MNLADLLPASRNRLHIEQHLRTVEQQILDALLRIEELLQPNPLPDPRLPKPKGKK